MSTAEATAPAGGRGLTWTKLLRWSAIAAIVDVALINLFSGVVIPPLVVFGFLWLGGIGWLARSTKGPAILLLVVFVAFLALSAPFVIPSLMVPASAGDFILNLLGLVAALTGIVAAVSLLRGRLGPVPAARSIALAAAVVFVVGTAGSVVATVTYDDAVLQEGDIELVTKDVEFEQTELQAGAGEVSVFVDNQDATLHTFTIDELDVNLDIPASKSARVSFDAEPGTYEFYCVPHEADMKGTITIE